MTVQFRGQVPVINNNDSYLPNIQAATTPIQPIAPTAINTSTFGANALSGSTPPCCGNSLDCRA